MENTKGWIVMEKEETRLQQCLQDCDMTKDKIEEYVCCKDADQLRLLHQQRKKLMDKLHKAQAQSGCCRLYDPSGQRKRGIK